MLGISDSRYRVSIIILSAVLFATPCIADESLHHYLLPSDHPVRPKLNDIFKDGDDVITSIDTLEEAGFGVVCDGKRKKRKSVYVVSHPELKGHLLKLYTHDQRMSKRLLRYQKRVIMAHKVRGAIEKYRYQRLLKVPNKWIYPIPRSPEASNDCKCLQFYVLVVEDMDLVSERENQRRWKSRLINRKLLRSVYNVVNDAWLIDHHINNIPFSRDGRASFIDLESQKGNALKEGRLKKDLPNRQKKYWQFLINKGNRQREQELAAPAPEPGPVLQPKS